MDRRLAIILFSGFFLGFGCKDDEGGYTCFPGNEGCPCIGELCLAGLECIGDVCEVIGDTTGEPTEGGSGSGPEPSTATK